MNRFAFISIIEHATISCNNTGKLLSYSRKQSCSPQIIQFLGDVVTFRHDSTFVAVTIVTCRHDSSFVAVTIVSCRHDSSLVAVTIVTCRHDSSLVAVTIVTCRHDSWLARDCYHRKRTEASEREQRQVKESRGRKLRTVACG